MRILPFIILFLTLSVGILAQSPHGNKLKVDCASCHFSTTWKINPDSIKFDHSSTGFALTGQHSEVNCVSCHQSLVFSDAEKTQDCFSCHKDIHRGSVGFDCERCHTPESWVVKDINVVHQDSRFPLVGAHRLADCQQCHADYQDLNFRVISIDCFSCHQADYTATTNPNHVEAGFSTNCEDCHDISSMVWSSTNFNHDFFPLVGGHNIKDCFQCHTQGSSSFKGLSTDCYSCHRANYEAATDPNHMSANFSTTCTDCHTINGWSPATFDHNLTQFPLTGAHVTVSCSSCHAQGFSGTPTDCYSCHQADYNRAPDHVSQNYPTDCTMCHSTSGWGESGFNHDNTGFPLTGAHLAVDCSNCHQNGFTTPPSTACANCHQADFNATSNPNHQAIGIQTNCQDCHTTNAGWQPATFPIHSNFYELVGAHANIANDCASCHNGNYNNTPNDCYGCHATDYNNTNDPNHQSAGFGTDCQSCHTSTAWQPASFDHDAQFFPIYSGHHNGTWNACSDCHTQSNDYSVFSCVTCHEHNQQDTDNHHQGVQGYIYQSDACLACHPTGGSDGSFNHDQSNFPLTGAHLTVDCSQCHQNGYTQPPPTACAGCHQTNFNNTTNPNHQSLGISANCETCHTTNPGWAPAQFPQHSQYFELLGQHASITDCNTCHNGNYNMNSAECLQCHQADYNNAANPNHTAAGIQTSCQDCHNASAWIPSTFNHTTTGFQLQGVHAQIQCSDCHQGTITGLSPNCVPCHQSDYNGAPNHVSQGYPTNCDLCHSYQAWTPANFDHNNTNFPLTGAHLQVQCSDCHANGFTGTPTACFACHETNYNNTTNPGHSALQLSTDCSTCHTTNPGWAPAQFPIHSNYFPFVGAHISIANDCASCHNGNYNNTPNTCYGCHSANFNSTTDPPHQQLNFSHDCLTCHNQNSWDGASFDHSFYSLHGNHASMACNNCHSLPNYQQQCLSCHQSDFNEAHGSNHSTACWDCHSTSHWGDAPVMQGIRKN